MGQEHHQLHILFFPFLSSSHMLPLVDMARLFAERGVRATIVTTPANVIRLRHAVENATKSGHSLHLLLLPFPSSAVGLPEGCENILSLPSSSPSHLIKFHQAIDLLREPLHQLLVDQPPDCIISDTIYHWTSDLALSLGIPRLVFHATSPFSVAISDAIEFHGTGDNDPFVVPGQLPHQIILQKSMLPVTFNYLGVLEMFREAEKKSYGAVLNSFDELAPEYVEHCRIAGKRKVWCVGPVSLCNKTEADRAERGGQLQGEEIKSYLDSKEPDSVLYVCFGSAVVYSHDQLRDLASGLENSGLNFIWVVGGDAEKWMPEGFEKRVEGKGLILKGWAPQVMILNSPAVGGFLTHCGWNSVLEGVSAGVAMIAWPLESDQFIHERLVVEVLGIGLRMGEGEEVVKAEKVTEVVRRLMGGGEEVREMERRAKEYGEMAGAAMEEGGSSYSNMSRLIEELAALAEKKYLISAV